MMDKTQSVSIDLLRFPLAVFVVFIHTPNTLNLMPVYEADFPLLSGTGFYNVLEILLKEILTHIAVPTFFVISGFLFFQNLTIWDWNIYKRKLLSRTKSLLLPYLCWITLSYLCIAGIPAVEVLFNGVSFQECWQTFLDNRYSLINCYIGKEHISQYGDWFGNNIILSSSPFTIGPLWFVRNLIVVVILSPLFYLLLKKTKIYGISLLGLLYLSDPNFHSVSAFYYGMGAFIAMNNKNVVTIAKQIRIPALTMAVICLILCIYFGGIHTVYGYRIRPFYVLSGVWSAFYISSYLVERWDIKPNKFLVQSCFFVYALHIAMFTKDTNLLSYSYKNVAILLNGIPHVELLQFLLPPIITILICLGIFWVVQRYTPCLCRLLTGNRG